MNGSYSTIYSQSCRMRQCRSAVAALAVAALSAFALAGCSAISIPLGDAAGTSDVNAPIDLTGNISDSAVYDVAPGDRQQIAAMLPAGLDETTAVLPLSWSNPDTGNSGTITDIVQADPQGTRGCARFTTSANTIEGLRNYTGMACPDSFATWHVTVLQRVDADS